MLKLMPAYHTNKTLVDDYDFKFLTVAGDYDFKFLEIVETLIDD